MPLNIEIKTIAHKDQRYNTAGDYFENDDGVVLFRISNLKNWKEEMLIAVHELIEYTLTTARGIKEQDITDFDIDFEKKVGRGDAPRDAEPGDEQKAPYYREHQFANYIERLLAIELQENWKEYEKNIGSLDRKSNK